MRELQEKQEHLLESFLWSKKEMTEAWIRVSGNGSEERWLY